MTWRKGEGKERQAEARSYSPDKCTWETQHKDQLIDDLFNRPTYLSFFHKYIHQHIRCILQYQQMKASVFAHKVMETNIRHTSKKKTSPVLFRHRVVITQGQRRSTIPEYVFYSQPTPFLRGGQKMKMPNRKTRRHNPLLFWPHTQGSIH